jgi:hypothetical protein
MDECKPLETGMNGYFSLITFLAFATSIGALIQFQEAPPTPPSSSAAKKVRTPSTSTSPILSTRPLTSYQLGCHTGVLFKLSVGKTSPFDLLRNRRSIYSMIATRSDLLRVGRWHFRNGQS